MENDVAKIGSNIYITISDFKGKKYIDVRKYFVDDEGNLAPTRKGISFTPEDWAEFVGKITEIDTEIKNLL